MYQQLFDQLSAQILNGDLPSDFNLPSIRTAAKELRVSIITVKKAWEELERSGLIYSVSGKGCFVNDLSSVERHDKRDEIIDQRLAKDVKYYREMGIGEQELVEKIREIYNS